MPKLLIIGSPRSGTTWLAKMFDAHPEVRYLHEPDLLVRIPRDWALGEQAPQDSIEFLRSYMQQWLGERRLKATASLPIFRKSEETAPAYAARASIIMAMKVAERLMARSIAQRLALPNNISRSKKPQYVVIKSISLVRHAGVVRRAFPQLKIVLIIRDPLSQVASMLKGAAENKFERPRLSIDERLLATAQARRYGLDAENVARMPPAQQLAWEWAISNDIALDELADDPNTRVIRYLDLVHEPARTMKELFDFSGLDWRKEVSQFVSRSSLGFGPRSYFSVFRKKGFYSPNMASDTQTGRRKRDWLDHESNLCRTALQRDDLTF